MTLDLLRISTAGSVDDGKSTLIGRLLYDTKSILQDQLDHVAEASQRRGGEGALDLALLTDGLRAEREQGITIDVAYRYFATPNRRFIIADCPGHQQYTRNMVTGASTADLAVVLIDARNGVLEQSKRHAFISALLGIPKLVVAVNKMDLVGHSQQRFEEIATEFEGFAPNLRRDGQRAGQQYEIIYIPISALNGDNVVDRSEAMDWYQGPALLDLLEQVEVAYDRPHDKPARFPVQWVIRPSSAAGASDYRAYAGQLASGALRQGDEVTVLPGGERTRIAGDRHLRGRARGGGRADVGRDSPAGRAGHLARRADLPHRAGTAGRARARGRRVLDGAAADAAGRALPRQADHAQRDGGRGRRSRTSSTCTRSNATRRRRSSALNDIARVRLRTSTPLVFDPYKSNRRTGSFIMIDETSNETVGAGMIKAAVA